MMLSSRHLFVALTYDCNAYCKKCMTRYHVSRGKNMSRETVMCIASLLKSYDYSGVITLGSGEPLLYGDLEYFINSIFSSSCNTKLRILSNGMALSPSLPSTYFDNRIIWGVTLDAFSQENLYGLQEGVDLEKVKRNIADIVDIYSPRSVYLNYTLNSKNIEDVIPFCKYASTLNIPEIYFTELKVYCGYEDKLLQYKIEFNDHLLHILEEAKVILSKSHTWSNIMSVGKMRPFRSQCYTYRGASPVIDVDGSTSFCAGREDYIVGNISDPDIVQRWKNTLEQLHDKTLSICSACHNNVLPNGLYNLPTIINLPRSAEQ